MAINGTSGDDNLTGTSGADTFNLKLGGNDTASGVGGDDIFLFGATFDGNDHVDGGTGNDLVRLDGDYSAGITLGATTLTDVETVQLIDGNSYKLTTNDGNVASGKSLYINGTALTAGHTLTFDGSAETDGFFRVTAGAGDDVLSLGAQLTAQDRITGGDGNDTLTIAGDYDLVLGSATLRGIDILALAAGHSYQLVTNNGTVDAGAILVVDARLLGATDNFVLNASHELDGSYDIQAGAGLTQVLTGSGADAFEMGAHLTAADRINGAQGADALFLNGDYTLTLSRVTLTSIENVHLAGGHSYHIVSGGGIATNQTQVWDATGLGAGDTLYLDFSRETAGSVIVDVANAQATLIGGAQGDAFDFSVTSQGGLVAGDKVDGGANYDRLYFDGDYTGAHALVMNATTVKNVEEFDFNPGHSYSVTIAAATVAHGASLLADGGPLGAADTLTFDGSAADSSCLLSITGGAGNDVLTGNNGNTAFDLSHGGNDTATGGSGSDLFGLGAALTASDTINGGAGSDTVSLNGDYSAGLTLGVTTLNGVETLLLLNGHSYKIATNDATVASGQTLTVNASALSGGNILTFDGSAETNGSFAITGGSGNDVLKGGTGADSFTINNGGNHTIAGGGGADTVTDNPFSGSQTFIFNAVSDSTGPNYDHINGVSYDNDVFHVSGIAGAVTGVDTQLTTGPLSTASFDSDLAAAVGASQLAAHHAVVFVPSSGDLANRAFLVIDENGTAGYQAEQDLVIWTQTVTGTLTTANFS